MLLKKIQLLNFISHKNTSIEFKKDQRLLISGISGSGKSSIVDALVWCLYNRGRSDNRSLIRKGEKTAKVVVWLETEEESFRIERSVTTMGKHDLEVFESKGKIFKPIKSSGLKNIQEHLENNILHSSYSLFVNSVIYPQDNTESFIKQSATKRKDIILEIIKTSDYDSYYEKAKSKLEEITDKIMSFSILKGEKEGRIINLNAITEKGNDFIIKERETEKKIEDLNKNIQDNELKEREEKEIRMKMTLLTEDELKKKEEVKHKEDEINLLKIKISDIGKQTFDLVAFELNMNLLNKFKIKITKLEEDEKKSNEWNNGYVKLLGEMPPNPGFKDKIKEIEDLVVSIQKEPITDCPETKKSCAILVKNRDERIRSLTDDLTRQKANFEVWMALKIEYDKKLTLLGEKPAFSYSELEKVRKDVEFLSNYEKEQIELKNSTKNKDEFTGNLNTLLKDKGILEELIGNINNEINILSGKMARDKVEDIEQLKKLKNYVETELVNIRSELKFIEKSNEELKIHTEEIKKINNEIENLNKDKENLELIKKAFGNNGIKAIMVDLVLPELEDRINNILSQFSDFKIKLNTQRKGVGDEVTLEGLFISVINSQGEEFSWDNYSGGEKMRITIAISEGLAELQKIKFRVLDEAIVGLDQETVEGFIKVINSMKDRFSQLICISHLERVQEEFEEKITVKKINGISEINN